MIRLYQGKDDLLEKTEQEQAIGTVKKKIEGFFDMKNVYFLFGSGTSTDAIPKMSILAKDVEDYLKEHSDEKLQKFYGRIAKKKGNNLEEILGVLYSKRSYLDGIELTTDASKQNLVRCKDLIDTIEAFIFDKLNVGSDNSSFEKVMNTYKTFYKKMAQRPFAYMRLYH